MSRFLPRPAGLLLALLAAGGPTLSQAVAPAPGSAALAREDIDALRAENRELQARIASLQTQRGDAERLIALKTARLQSLEKPRRNP